MLYFTLKFLLRITLRVFFNKVHLRNFDKIPAKGPLLICANHPSAFMDPIVIAALTKRPIYFLAKAAVFKSKLAQWLLPKLNMIPIYRKQDDPSQMHKNEQTFDKCYDHLAKGGVLIIFPEGTSITERKLRDIKSGAARIVLGAEKKYNYKLNIKVVTIGLNYSDPHRFRQEVFANADEPIAVSDYYAAFQADEVKAVEQLTSRIREQLAGQIVALRDDDSDELLARIETLYKDKQIREQGLPEEDAYEDLQLTRRMAEALYYFQDREPDRVEAIRNQINTYFGLLERLRLNDKLLNQEQPRQSMFGSNALDFLFLLLGLPLFVFGFVGNILPFFLIDRFVRSQVKQYEFRGAVAMAGGMVLYLIWYIAIGVLCWHYLFPNWKAIALTLSLLPAGMWAYYYYIRARRLGKRWFYIALFYKRADLVADLIKKREALVEEFDKALVEYRKWQADAARNAGG